MAFIATNGARNIPGGLQDLKTAKSLWSRHSPEHIRRATGWFKEPDGQWRFEVADAGAARLTGYEPRPGELVPLDKVLHHPALFAAVPKLREVRVGRLPPNKCGIRGGYARSYALATGRAVCAMIEFPWWRIPTTACRIWWRAGIWMGHERRMAPIRIRCCGRRRAAIA